MCADNECNCVVVNGNYDTNGLPPHGTAFIGYKIIRLHGPEDCQKIVKVVIPEEAFRVRECTGKCRASAMLMLDGFGEAPIQKDFTYELNTRYECKDMCLDIQRSCCPGLYFYSTFEEALKH